MLQLPLCIVASVKTAYDPGGRAQARTTRSVGGLRLWLGVGYGLLTILLAAALAALVEVNASRRLSADVGERLAAQAGAMAARLEDGLTERLDDIRVLAMLPALREPEGRQGLMPILRHLRETTPEYAWIGYADRDGTVLAATDGLMVGENVGEQPWFRAALDGPFLGDVHEAAAPAPGPDGGPLRLIDVAAPAQDERGQVLGVAGAHLALGWAERQRRQPPAGSPAEAAPDVLVADRRGTVLLGPPALRGDALPAGIEADLSKTHLGYRFVAWPDGDYLTGYARPAAQASPAGLGWRVIVRLPVDAAMAGVRDMRRQILIAALGMMLLSALAAVLVARRLGAPLHALAEAAVRLRARVPGASLPAPQGYREARQLGAALADLMDDVAAREAELRRLAETLEQRVEERTRELREANAELGRMAVTDPLTGLSNRRHFDDQFVLEVGRARRQRRPLALLLADIDLFKSINDQYGHPVGDYVLRLVAEILDHAVRPNDVIARIGGEEFAVVAADIAADQARELAERLRTRIAEHSPLDLGRLQVPVSISIGLAMLDGRDQADDQDAARQLYARADMALYRAKRGGRDRVEVAVD